MTGPARIRPAPAALFLLLGLVLISTARSLGSGLAFDDVPIVAENGQIHALAAPWVYAQQSYWPPDNLGDAYRPWTIWWFAIQWALGGGAPWLFHLGNLALTAALTTAVYLLGLELLPSVGALAAAALFAVHPVHVEATGNVVGQGELWMTLFSVLAALAYVRARRNDSLDARTRIGLGVLLVLAAASKEQGFVLPGMLLLIEWLVRRTGDTVPRPRAVATTFIVLAVVSTGLLAARYAVLGDLGGGPPAAGLEGQGLLGRSSIMLPIVLDWARLLIWPAALSAQYSPPATGGTASLALAIMGVAGLAGFGMLAGWGNSRSRVIPFGIAWTALALLPVSNVAFPTGVLLAERTLLLPSVGIVLAAGAIFAHLGLETRLRRVAIGGLAVLIVLGAARSYSRQAVWRDNPTLVAQTIIDQPGGYRGYFIFGRELVRRGDPTRAAAMYRLAADRYAGDYRVFEEWGQILRAENRCGDAIPIFERGLRVYPDGTVIRSRLFECLLTIGRVDDAITIAEAGIARGLPEFAKSVERAQRARTAPPNH